MWREGYKVNLPSDLGIVEVTVHDANDDTTDNTVFQGRADLTRDEAFDLIDLSDLGGAVCWPPGWDYGLVKEFIKSG